MKKSTEDLIVNYLEQFDLKAFINHVKIIIELVAKFNHYNKILICGNGGSCADSMHIVGELMKSFRIKRPIDSEFKLNYTKHYDEDDLLYKTQGTIRAISLASEASLITAISNDIGQDYIFSQQVYGYADKGDILFAFSTSGNSISIVNAAKVAKAKGVYVVGFTGLSGGILKDYVDLLFNVSAIETFEIQQLHQILYHVICLALENEVFSNDYCRY